MTEKDQQTQRNRTFAVVLVIALAHGLVAYLASRPNASTFDEPLHVAAAVATLHGHGGINPEHPPLWKYVAGLPHLFGVFPAPPAGAYETPTSQWGWAVEVLYHTPVQSPGLGGDGEAMVARSRVAQLVWPMALILLGAHVAYRVSLLAGTGPGGRGQARRAALLVAGLLALDPLLLAHGPIVSNDVAVSVFLLATIYAALPSPPPLPSLPPLPDQTLTWKRAVVLGMLVAASLTSKFTGVLAYPLVILLAGLRQDRLKAIPRLMVAFGVSYLLIWVIYGPPVGVNIGPFVDRVVRAQADAAGERTAGAPDLLTRLVVWIHMHHLLPQPLTAGLLMSYSVTRSNPAFAAGHFSKTGWWWYFPFAAMVKEPVALLGLWAVGLVLAVRRRAEGLSPAFRGLLVGAGVLLVASLASPLDIGLRHFLPFLTVMSVVAGIALASVRGPLLRIGFAFLALESLLGFPRYLSFFNVPARMVGPEKLLGDSNLDWGQDLGRLARWRKAHPEGTLYLAYWGTADPNVGPYFLDAVHLPGTYDFASRDQVGMPSAERPGYIAVSVTYLQGLTREGKGLYPSLQARPAEFRVGNSILIWRYPARYGGIHHGGTENTEAHGGGKRELWGGGAGLEVSEEGR